MNVLNIYNKFMEFAFAGYHDKQLFNRLASKYKIELKNHNNELTIPPLINSVGTQRIGEFYLLVAPNQKLYRFYTKVDNNTEFAGAYWVYELSLKHELPYFIIDSIFNTVGIEKIFSDFQEVQLEGDFSEFFKLYIPTHDQISVLSVIGPDLMQKIYEFWDQIDLIVAGKKAWMVIRSGWPIDKDVEIMLKAGPIISEELIHRSKSFRP